LTSSVELHFTCFLISAERRETSRSLLVPAQWTGLAQ
jgi:hypothetical protein